LVPAGHKRRAFDGAGGRIVQPRAVLRVKMSAERAKDFADIDLSERFGQGPSAETQNTAGAT
jgi:hypothetical protein